MKAKIIEQTLFEVPAPTQVAKSKSKNKKKQTKEALRLARRRWRVTYNLRKKGLTVNTHSKEILIQEKPDLNSTKGWVEELINKGYHVQFTI